MAMAPHLLNGIVYCLGNGLFFARQEDIDKPRVFWYSIKRPLDPCWCGAMAAQLICNQWVAGSTPVTSSKKSRSGTLISGRLLLLCFCFRHKNPKIPQKMLTNYHPGGNIYRQSMDCKTEYGRVPEWPMGTDCKSAAFSFGGSNPPAPTKQEKSEPVSDWRRVRIFRFLRVQQRRLLWTVQNSDALS